MSMKYVSIFTLKFGIRINWIWRFAHFFFRLYSNCTIIYIYIHINTTDTQLLPMVFVFQLKGKTSSIGNFVKTLVVKIIKFIRISKTN